MSRRIGRILAFQTLYPWSVGEIPIDNLLDFSWVTRDKDEDDVPSEKSSEKSLEQVIGEGEKPVPVNGVKYFLTDGQFKLFERLEPSKKDEVFAFSRLLAKGTVENIDEIDALIKKHLSENWSIDRINKVALSVMRIAVYELLYQKNVPATIVIDEAVEIVKSYGEDDAHRFTNAVLDNIKKALTD